MERGEWKNKSEAVRTLKIQQPVITEKVQESFLGKGIFESSREEENSQRGTCKGVGSGKDAIGFKNH